MFDENVKEPSIQWMVRNGNAYQVCGRTVKKLPAGAYSCSSDGCGNPVYQGRSLEVDDLVDFPGSLPARVLDEIDRFWTMGDRFRKHGFLHRRGYLFYGKQGCGKSSLIHLVIAQVIEAGHVAFFCDQPPYFVACMEQFRQVEPDRPMVCIFEDIDAIIRHYGDSYLLQWLDGNHQVNKAINLATTNYPESLDRRIIARPRRFDRILRIETPDAQLRQAYFGRKLPELAPDELERWVELSDGLPFAALAELIISVCCLGNDLAKTADLLRRIDQDTPSSEDDDRDPEVEDDPLPAMSLAGEIPF
jgi:ATPase family associated with various cellular activities (AAA)